MAAELVRCSHCQGVKVMKYGTMANGKERFRYQKADNCGRTYIREYAYRGR